MMHVRFNEAWHGMAKCNKQHYNLSGAQYATELHIEENTTTSYLVRSRLCIQQY